MVLRNFLDKKVFFLHVAIVLTCFQSEKSQNKFDLMQSFFLKCLKELVNINLRGSKAKTVTPQLFSILIFAWICTKALFYILSRLSVSKLLRKALKIATKACNNERIISSYFQPEVDASLNITRRKVMITYDITKSHQFRNFDSLVLTPQEIETETLKTQYIHVYKVFG